MADGSVTIEAILNADKVKQGIQEIKGALNGLQTDAMGDLGNGAQDAAASVDRASESVDGLGTTLVRTRGTGRDWTKSMQTAGQSIEKVGNSLTKCMTAPLLGAAAAGVASAVSIDTSLTNVRKTVDGTEEDYQRLKDAAVEFSKTNAVSASQMLDIEALGAQLGFSIDELQEFGEVVSGLDIATNMDAETAATQLAQFANITGMSHDEIRNFGSSIVDLGNNFATTEADVMNMAMRIAGTGTTIGMTVPEILGMATALSSVGIEAEAGGTAISTIMSTIDKQVAIGGDQLQVWADTAKMSVDEFVTAWQTRPAEALQAVILGMADATDESGALNMMLEDLGITAIRQGDALKRLANNPQLLADAIRTANQAYQENTALSREVENRNDSLAAKFEMLKNRLVGIAEQIGEPLANALLDALDAAEPLFEAIENGANAFANMSKEQQQTVLQVAALSAAIGPVLSIIGRLGQGVGTVIQQFAKWGGAATDASGKVTGAISAANVAVGALKAGLVGLAFAGAATIIDQFAKVQARAETASSAVDNMSAAMDAMNGIVMDDVADSVDNVAVSYEELIDGAQEALQAQADLGNEMKNQWTELDAKGYLLDQYVDTIERLQSQGNLSAEDFAELQTAVAGVNDIMGTSYSVIDQTTGALNVSTDALNANAEAWEANARAQAGMSQLQDLEEQRIKNNQELTKIQEQLNGMDEKHIQLTGESARQGEDLATVLGNQEANAYANLVAQKDALIAANEEIDASEKQITDMMTEEQEKLLDLSETAQTVSEVLTNNKDFNFEKWAQEQGVSIDEVSAKLSALGISTEDLGRLNSEQLQSLVNNWRMSSIEMVNLLEGMKAEVPQALRTMAERAKQALENDMFAGWVERSGASVDAVISRFDDLGISIEEMAQMTPEMLDVMMSGCATSIEGFIAECENAGIEIPEYFRQMMDESTETINEGAAEMEESVSEAAQNIARKLSEQDWWSDFTESTHLAVDEVAKALEDLGFEAEDTVGLTAEKMTTIFSGSADEVAEIFKELDIPVPENLEEVLALIQDTIADAMEDTAEETDELTEEQTKQAEQAEDAVNQINDRMQTVVEEIKAKVDEIRNYLTEMGDDFLEIGRSLGNALSTGFSEADMQSLYEKMEEVKTKVDDYKNEFEPIGTSHANSLATGFYEADMRSVYRAMDRLIKNVEDYIDQFEEVGIEHAEAYIKGILSKREEAYDAGRQLAERAVDGMRSVDAYPAGVELGQGYVNGILSMIGAAYNAGYRLGASAAKGIRDGQASGSPSKIARKWGRFFGIGYIMGIKEYFKDAYGAGRDLAMEAIHGADTYTKYAAKDAGELTAEMYTLGLRKKLEAEKNTIKDFMESAAVLAGDSVGHSGNSVSDAIWGNIWGEVKNVGYEGMREGNVYEAMQKIEDAGYKDYDDLMAKWDKFLDERQDYEDQELDWQERLMRDAEEQARKGGKVVVKGYKLNGNSLDSIEGLYDAVKDDPNLPNNLKWRGIGEPPEYWDRVVARWLKDNNMLEEVELTQENKSSTQRGYERWKREFDEWLPQFYEIQDLVHSLPATGEELTYWKPLYDMKKEVNESIADTTRFTETITKLGSKAGVTFSKNFIERVVDGGEEYMEALERMADATPEEIQEMVDAFDDADRSTRELEIDQRSLWVNSLYVMNHQGQDARDWILDFRETCLDVKEAIYSDDSLYNAFERLGVTVEEFALGLQSSGHTMDEFQEKFTNFVTLATDGFNGMSRDNQSGLEHWVHTLENNIVETEHWAQNLENVFSRAGGEGVEAFRQAVMEGGFEQFGQVIAEMATASTEEINTAIETYYQALLVGQETGIQSFMETSGSQIAMYAADGLKEGAPWVADTLRQVIDENVKRTMEDAQEFLTVGGEISTQTGNGIREKSYEVDQTLEDLLFSALQQSLGNANSFYSVGSSIGTSIASGVMSQAGAIQAAISSVTSLTSQLASAQAEYQQAKEGQAKQAQTVSVAPTVKIDWYAKGGIFDRAQIIGVGERGPEAVIPLSASGLKPLAQALNQTTYQGDSISNAITLNATVRDAADGERLARRVGVYTNRMARARGRRRA